MHVSEHGTIYLIIKQFYERKNLIYDKKTYKEAAKTVFSLEDIHNYT